MPGARLTQDDRHQIEAWLTDGLGYAEIGRRLGRPTSTISREVARNGVPGAYRSDNAQRATGDRARRSRPGRPSADASSPEPPRRFVDEFALLLAATGMPRMTARIFVSLLIADGGGLTSAELVRQLQVSPASVSKSIAYLEAMGLVRRHPDRSGRRDRYLIDDDVWMRAWQADTGAHGEIARAARRGLEIFGAETIAGARLSRMDQFFARLSEQMADSSLAEPTVYDALTVVAALVDVGRPLTLDALSAALGWPRERARTAVEAIERRPGLADPLALRIIGPTTYALHTRPDRLTPAQRDALRSGRHTP